jgi:hypothetical protein
MKTRTTKITKTFSIRAEPEFFATLNTVVSIRNRTISNFILFLLREVVSTYKQNYQDIPLIDEKDIPLIDEKNTP